MFPQSDSLLFVALAAALGVGGLSGFIVGLLVGAALVLALAPQAGSEIRGKVDRLFRKRPKSPEEQGRA